MKALIVGEQLQQKVELINRSRSQLVQFLRGLANSTSLSQARGATPERDAVLAAANAREATP